MGYLGSLGFQIRLLRSFLLNAWSCSSVKILDSKRLETIPFKDFLSRFRIVSVVPLTAIKIHTKPCFQRVIPVRCHEILSLLAL